MTRALLLVALAFAGSGCATTEPMRLSTLPKPAVESDMDALLPEMRALFVEVHPELEVRLFSPRHEQWSLPKPQGSERPTRRAAYIGAGVQDRRTGRCFYLVPVFSMRREENGGEWGALKLREHMPLEYLATPERRLQAHRLLETERLDGESAAPIDCALLPVARPAGSGPPEAGH